MISGRSNFWPSLFLVMAFFFCPLQKHDLIGLAQSQINDLDFYENVFRKSGVVGEHDFDRLLESPKVDWSKPEDFLIFLANSIRRLQLLPLLESRALQALFQAEASPHQSINTTFDQTRSSSLSAFVKDHESPVTLYKTTLIRAAFLEPTFWLDLFPFRSASKRLPSAVKVSFDLRAYTEAKTIDLSAVDRTNLLHFIHDNIVLNEVSHKFSESGRAPLSTTVSEPDMERALAQFFTQQRNYGPSYHQTFIAIKELRTKVLEEAARLIPTANLLPFFESFEMSPSGFLVALQNQENFFERLLFEPLRLDILLSLSEDYKVRLGQEHQELPAFIESLQQQLSQRQTDRARTSTLFTAGVCSIFLVVKAWPVCAFVGSTHWLKGAQSQYSKFRQHSQHLRFLDNMTSPENTTQKIREDYEGLIWDGFKALLLPIGLVKTLPQVANGSSRLPLIDKVGEFLKRPLVSKNQPVRKRGSFLTRPFRCFLGQCKAADRAFDFILGASSAQSARQWFRPFVVPYITYQTVADHIRHWFDSELVNELATRPEDPFYGPAQKYADLLRKQPQLLGQVVNTLYPITTEHRYKQIRDLYETQGLGLFEIENLMAEVDDHLAWLTESHLARGIVRRFLADEISWFQMNQQASAVINTNEEVSARAQQLFREDSTISIADEPGHPSFHYIPSPFLGSSLVAQLEYQFEDWGDALALAFFKEKKWSQLPEKTRSTLMRYYILQGLIDQMFYDQLLSFRFPEEEGYQEAFRQLVSSGLALLSSIAGDIYSENLDSSPLREAFEHLSFAFQNGSKDQPVTLFSLDRYNTMVIDEEFPVHGAISIARQLNYYFVLQSLHHPNENSVLLEPLITLSPTGNYLSSDKDDLLAIASRGFGHTVSGSSMMAHLSFSQPFDKESFDITYLKGQLNDPVFQRIINSMIDRWKKHFD